MGGSARALLAGLAVAAALGACRSPVEGVRARTPPAVPDAAFEEGLRRPTYLAELFAAGEARVETPVFELDQPARRGGATGFGGREAWGRRGFAWATGERAEIPFLVTTPRDLEARFVAWQSSSDPGPDETVTVSVGETAIGELRLRRRAGSSYRLTIPAAALREGMNRLRLRHSGGFRPRALDPASPDVRTLYAVWQRIELRGSLRGAAPRVEEAPGPPILLLPAGSELELSALVPPGTRLVVDRVRPLAGSDPGWKLTVEVQRPDREPTRHEVRRSAALSIPVDPPIASPVRIVLRATAGRSGDGVELVAARLEPPRDLPAAPAEASPEPTVARPARGPEARPNVVVFLIDALRADHLHAFGYPRPTSPRIDAFAAGATRFLHAEAQSSWTRPSVVSLLSGLAASRHGVNGARSAVPPSVVLLPEILRAAGYATAAVVTNGVVSAPFGFARGFESFRYLEERTETPELHRRAGEASGEAIRWLRERDRARPFFLYLHATDPHAPYAPERRFLDRLGLAVSDPARGSLAAVEALDREREAPAEAIRDVVALYDAEIGEADEAFGALLDELDREGIGGRTLVILVADHGEEFGEHRRWQHGWSLAESLLHVPLVLRAPAGVGAGESVATLVRQIDLAPTVLDVAGLPIPSAMQGRSLRPLLLDPGRDDDRPSSAYLARDPDQIRLASIRVGDLKAIHAWTYDRAVPTVQLFDLAADPGELRDLGDERPVWRSFLGARARSMGLEAPPGAGLDAPIDPDLERQLRALGYLR